MATPELVVDVSRVPKNIQTLGTALANAAAMGQLQIPSQKNGICVNDSLTSAFFYSDEIRDLMWGRLIFPHSVLRVSCQHRLSGAVGAATAASDKAAVLTCWLQLTAARVAGIVQGQPILESTGRPVRMPSEQYGQDYPLGDTCGRLGLLYNGVTRREITRGSLGVIPEYEYALMSGIVEFAKPFLPGIDFRPSPPGVNPGTNVVAIVLTIGSPRVDADHNVAISRIGGKWYWCDNEVGIALALPSGINPLEYSFGVAAGDRYTLTYMQGGIRYMQTYPYAGITSTMNENSRYLLSVPPGMGARAVQTAAPGYVGVVGYGVPAVVPQPVVAPLPPPIAFPSAPSNQSVSFPSSASNFSLSSFPSIPSPARNPYDPQAAVKDAFGTWNQGGRRRRKTTFRRSSLPKRKAPSSGRSRDYTRRLRASRSGRGGYRATKTGRKV